MNGFAPFAVQNHTDLETINSTLATANGYLESLENSSASTEVLVGYSLTQLAVINDAINYGTVDTSTNIPYLSSVATQLSNIYAQNAALYTAVSAILTAVNSGFGNFSFQPITGALEVFVIDPTP